MSKKQPNPSTILTCPVCGARFALPEHEHFAAGVAVGKDSGLGEIHPALEEEQPAATRRNRAQERLDALKAAGIDTTGLFALQGAADTNTIIRITDGIPTVVNDDDKIFQAILGGKTIPERRLFRRWVMAQAFRMLENGFTQELHRKGYAYQWRMTVEELRIQSVLYAKDPENFKERNRWFNKKLVMKMIDDYMTKLNAYVKDLPEKKCKGKPYVHIHGMDVFIADLEAKVYAPLRANIVALGKCRSPKYLYKALNKFYLEAPALNDTQSEDWANAYKGAGAYFTLKNLILFHEAVLPGPNTNAYDQLDKESSLQNLEYFAEKYKNRGWVLLGKLKDTLKQNNIDIAAKRREWSEAKRQRAAAKAAAAA